MMKSRAIGSAGRQHDTFPMFGKMKIHRTENPQLIFTILLFFLEK
jgi:hypothetical protein